MSVKVRFARMGSLGLLVGGLFGCSTLADRGIAVPYIGDPPIVAIDRLNEKPKGALVYLRGIVGDHAPFLAGGAYLLKDDSGTIWIRTNSPRLPKKGQEIVVKGKIDFQSIPSAIQETNAVYVQEVEQMEAVAVKPSPTPTPTVKPSPTSETKPPNPTPVAVKPTPPKPLAEIVPPQPPAASKPRQDPLDSFFLPHKQTWK